MRTFAFGEPLGARSDGARRARRPEARCAADSRAPGRRRPIGQTTPIARSPSVVILARSDGAEAVQRGGHDFVDGGGSRALRPSARPAGPPSGRESRGSDRFPRESARASAGEALVIALLEHVALELVRRHRHRARAACSVRARRRRRASSSLATRDARAPCSRSTSSARSRRSTAIASRVTRIGDDQRGQRERDPHAAHVHGDLRMHHLRRAQAPRWATRNTVAYPATESAVTIHAQVRPSTSAASTIWTR